MNTAAHAGDPRTILIGVLEAKIDRGLLSRSEALGRAYDAGIVAGEEPPTVRARSLKDLISAAESAARKAPTR